MHYVVIRSVDGWFATGRALGPRGYSWDLRHARLYPSLAAACAEAGTDEHVVAVERLLREGRQVADGFGEALAGRLVPLDDPKLGERFLAFSIPQEDSDHVSSLDCDSDPGLGGVRRCTSPSCPLHGRRNREAGGGTDDSGRGG